MSARFNKSPFQLWMEVSCQIFSLCGNQVNVSVCLVQWIKRLLKINMRCERPLHKFLDGVPQGHELLWCCPLLTKRTWTLTATYLWDQRLLARSHEAASWTAYWTLWYCYSFTVLRTPSRIQIRTTKSLPSPCRDIGTVPPHPLRLHSIYG